MLIGGVSYQIKTVSVCYQIEHNSPAIMHVFFHSALLMVTIMKVERQEENAYFLAFKWNRPLNTDRVVMVALDNKTKASFHHASTRGIRRISFLSVQVAFCISSPCFSIDGLITVL
jgi:hypothetical protein